MNRMIKNDILILGGGTAGLVTALILKTRFPKKEISVVKSDKIGVIGVGEGSNEEWSYFVKFCGLDSNEVIRETDATVKLGIKYVNWTDKDYIHNVDDRFYGNSFVGQFAGSFISSYINADNQIQTTDVLMANNKVPNTNQTCSNQYHFNALKLRDYLEKKCRERSIKVYTDEIKNVITNENGIDYIIGEKQYKSDFYIDSSGFKKVLIGELGVKWNSYAEYLPVNEAIAFPTDDTDEYPLYTSSTAMKYGWMWNTPVYGRWGNGYVFDNRYINAEQAQKECEDYLGFKVNVAKNIKFDAGALDRPWIGNCVAMGLSASFIEPLEASSIGTSIQQSFLLMHTLINYKQTDIDQYNQKVKEIVENIRDFVLLHYMVDKKDSRFWKEFKPNLPDTLKHNLEKWSDRLPINEDFKNNYTLFNAHNFAVLLKELNLVNKESIKREYEMIDQGTRGLIKNSIASHIKTFKYNIKAMSHKKYLNTLRNENSNT